MLTDAQEASPVIFVKGLCTLCGKEVWNNELRWKSYTPEGEYEGYVHKACYDKLHPPKVCSATTRWAACSFEPDSTKDADRVQTAGRLTAVEHLKVPALLRLVRACTNRI